MDEAMPCLPAERPDDRLLAYYDDHLRRHGDTAQGAAWPDEAGRIRRFDVLTEALRNEPGSPVLCDLGCGTGELLRHLHARGRADIGYIGVDRSELALSHARAKYPEARWVGLDVLAADDHELDALACDYLVANGLFTVRHDLSDEAMWAFMTGVLTRLWPRVRRAIVFNVMSPVVDWERDDLFHVSHDRMARFLHGLAGRQVQMRADYGLYEYTCLAFRPAPPEPPPAVEGGPVPAYRPLLPTADRLLPYLRRTDRTRLYSNHGPLVAALESRLCDRFGLAPGRLICAGSGTAALVAAILATAGRATPERPHAICPSYTFIGTAVALQQCGYVPWLVDVDPVTWQLDPEVLGGHPALDRVGLVVPVSAYGRAVPLAGWERFRREHGVPVVVDAAAAFEAVLADPPPAGSSVPLALSFHATKSFATGEGGAVIAGDATQAEAAYRALNFGFLMSRESHGPSINGKMAEHAAAVGLASLDGWEVQQAALHAVAAGYREAFALRGIEGGLHTAPSIAGNYVLLECATDALRQRLEAELRSAGIETRQWYGRGLHWQPALAGVPADDLPVTERVASRVLGLPVAPDLSRATIDRIADLAVGVSTGVAP